MPVLKYKNPSTGLWVTLPLVSSGGLDQTTADLRYLKLTPDPTLPVQGNLDLASNIGVARYVRFMNTGGTLRWTIGKSSAAETGVNNTGSDLEIYRYTDAGAVNGSPIISIARTNGQVVVNAPLATAPCGAAAAGFRIQQGSLAPTAPVTGDMWMLSTGLYFQTSTGVVGPVGTGGSGGFNQAAADPLYVNVSGDTMSANSTLVTAPAVAANAGLRVPLATATPSSPVHGDIWTTATGIFCRIGSTTVGPLVDKTYVDTRTPKITVGSTAPSGPAIGDVWIDTT